MDFPLAMVTPVNLKYPFTEKTREVLLPLNLSDFAPGPVMLILLVMVGSWDKSVMVPVTFEKTMSPLETALASRIACRSDPDPESEVLETKKVAALSSKSHTTRRKAVAMKSSCRAITFGGWVIRNTDSHLLFAAPRQTKRRFSPMIMRARLFPSGLESSRDWLL